MQLRDKLLRLIINSLKYYIMKIYVVKNHFNTCTLFSNILSARKFYEREKEIINNENAGHCVAYFKVEDIIDFGDIVYYTIIHKEDNSKVNNFIYISEQQVND